MTKQNIYLSAKYLEPKCSRNCTRGFQEQDGKSLEIKCSSTKQANSFLKSYLTNPGKSNLFR